MNNGETGNKVTVQKSREGLGEEKGRGSWLVLYHYAGGPLSDVLLEREKQRRTSDKKHSPEKHKVSLIPKASTQPHFCLLQPLHIASFPVCSLLHYTCNTYMYGHCTCTVASFPVCSQRGVLENEQLFNWIYMTLLFRNKNRV